MGGCFVEGQDGGCYKLTCDVADQRNVSVSAEFKDIYLMTIFYR